MSMRNVRMISHSSYLNSLKMTRIYIDLGLLPYRPRFKCGASTRLGYSQLEQQKEENQVNRDWQTAEAEKARQYDTSERVASQDWQQYMVDYQNEYNAPKNQAVRLREAGINPQIAMSGQVQNVSSNPSTSSPSSSPMPSGVSGLSPVSMQPFELQIPNILNSLGSFMKNVGEAQKLGVDTDYAKKSFDLNLRKLTADASLQEFVSKGVQLDNALKYANFDANQKKAVYEYKKLAWEVFLTEQQGISEQLQQKVLKSQEHLNNELARYHGANADLVKMDIKYFADLVKVRMDLMRSETSKNLAGARDLSASAEGKELQNNISRATNLTDIDNALYNSDTLELFRQSSDKQQLFQQLERDLRNTSLYKNSETASKIEASLQRLAKMLGLHTSVSASVSGK